MTRRRRDRLRRARNPLLRLEAVGLGRRHAIEIARCYSQRELLDGAGACRRWRAGLLKQPKNEPSPCPRCDGKGCHHGFGEDGVDPDWCLDCGGCGATWSTAA